MKKNRATPFYHSTNDRVSLLPEMDLSEWCKRYALEIKEGICPICNMEVKTTVPFRTTHYVGLMTPDCPSCGHSLTAWTSIAISKKEIDFIKDLFDKFQQA